MDPSGREIIGSRIMGLDYDDIGIFLVAIVLLPYPYYRLNNIKIVVINCAPIQEDQSFESSLPSRLLSSELSCLRILRTSWMQASL